VIATQDFLQLLARCLPAVEADDTLVGVSAWNINGLSFSLLSLICLLIHYCSLFNQQTVLEWLQFILEFQWGVVEDYCRRLEAFCLNTDEKIFAFC